MVLASSRQGRHKMKQTHHNDDTRHDDEVATDPTPVAKVEVGNPTGGDRVASNGDTWLWRGSSVISWNTWEGTSLLVCQNPKVRIRKGTEGGLQTTA